MLGLLKMSVDECILKYEDFMKKIFNKGTVKKLASFAWGGQFYDATILENLIKDLIREKTGSSETLLRDEGNPCKVY